MDPDIAMFVLVYVPMLVVGFFASLIYWSLACCGDGTLSQMADDGNTKAEKALALREDIGRLAEDQTGIHVLCMGAAAVAACSLSLSSPLLWAAVGLILYFALALLVPKSIAQHKGHTLALNLLWGVKLLRIVAFPLLLIPRALRSCLLMPFGMHKKAAVTDDTEEKIMMMLDEGEQSGTILDNERDMIEGIFELDDTDAGAIMTHRTDIVALDKEDHLDKALELIRTEGYSRIPVYDQGIDDIIGVLFAKDLLMKTDYAERNRWTAKDIMRPIFYVPESVKCRDLITAMREKKAQMAVVVDEYGGTSGIVTMEDVLETIVGSIQDEYDDEEAEVTKQGENVLSIDGTLPLNDVEELLDIQLPQQTDYDTLSGLLMDLLGRIPDEKEHPSVEVQGWNLRVENMEDRRITRVLATRIEI